MRTSAHDAVLLGMLALSLLPAACGRSQTGQGNGAGDGDEGNLLLIQPGTGQIFAKMTAPPLTVADAEAIEREGKAAVTGVAPVIRIRTQVRHDDKTFTPLFLHGTTPHYFRTRAWNLEQGRVWNDEENDKGAAVCVLGQTMAHELFGNAPAVGKDIELNGRSLKVIGLLAGKGPNAMGLDRDDIMLAPWKTIAEKADGNVDQILVRVKNTEQIEPVVRQITELLRKRHRLPPGQPDDFNIRDRREWTKALAPISH